MGAHVTSLPVLTTAAHAARLGEKLRREGLGTDHVTVFYHTSEHEQGRPSRSVTTTVIDKGDRPVLNGRKTFISGVDSSDAMMVVARSGTDEPTLREIQLLELLDHGLTNDQVADQVSLSVSTVKWHLHNLYVKLGVRSRSAALARSRAMKLIGRP